MMTIEEKNSCDSVGVKVECWLQLILIILYFFTMRRLAQFLTSYN